MSRTITCSNCGQEGHKRTNCIFPAGANYAPTLDPSALGRHIERKEENDLEVSQGPGIIITKVSIRRPDGWEHVYLGDIVVPKRRVGLDEYFRLESIPEGTIGIVFKFDDPTRWRDFIYIRWMKGKKSVRGLSSAHINDIAVVHSGCGM